MTRDVGIAGGAWEAFLDLLLPLSLLGFVFERSQDPTGMILILVIWLGLKFLLRLAARPLVWFLLGVLTVSLAEIFHPATISSPSDLILTLLAFAAGVNREDRQWRISLWILPVISVASLLFVEFDRINENLSLIPIGAVRDWLPAGAVRIQKVTINRSGYIFGLLSLIGYGLFRHGDVGLRRWLAILMALVSYVLAFGTGSRAAAGLPLMAVVVVELAWRQRSRAADLASPLTALLMAAGLLFNTAIYAPWSPLAYRNPSDAGRANVAQCFVRQSLDYLPDLLTGHGDDRVSDICRSITIPNPGRMEGPPHAHNTFLQALGDHGLLAALMLLVAIGLSFQKNLLALKEPSGLLSTVGLTTTFFIFCSALVESTLIKTSLQQVLSGYILSLAWRRRGEGSGIAPLVNHVGQHGEHQNIQAGDGQ